VFCFTFLFIGIFALVSSWHDLLSLRYEFGEG
jgi:hypothetical protein